MGIQINGQTDRISAVDGSFSIQDLAEVNVTGVATASNFKSGTSNVHSTGYECTNINATGIVTAASANFTGNVSVGGTLTYQDVTNIDSVGVITARSDVSIADKIVHTGDTDTAIRFPASDTFTVETAGNERLRITSDGDVNIKEGNLQVGHDAATLDFTDSNSNTRFIEVGASSGDALFVAHSAGAGVGYFGYEAGGDRLVVACDNGSGSNKIDFIVNAGTTTGGGTDNLNNVSPALRITSGSNVGINETSPDTTLHISKSAAQNDSNGILKVESTNTGSGAQANASLVVKNRFGFSQFMQWEEEGLRIGSRGLSAGGVGEVHITCGSDAVAMKIDGSGRIIRPLQPSFHATNTTIGQINTDGYGTIVFNDVTNNGNHNIGNHYNASTGVFTAPIAGRYLICARTLTNSTANSNAYVAIWVRLNGANLGYLGHNHTDSWIMESYSGVLSLAANDTVTIVVDQASAHGYQNYSSFSGHLLS